MEGREMAEVMTSLGLVRPRAWLETWCKFDS